MDISVKSDVIKLQLHLSLLKDEYVKLQNYCSDLERKYSLAIAKHGEVNENGFLSKLLKIVGGLFNQDQYSDIKVKLDGQLISAHRFVLSARSESWGVTSLFHADLLDWSMLNPDVGRAVLKWVYTDEVDFFDGDKFTLDLMCTANEFKLDELVTKCEKVLIASANIKNCISLYTTACQMGANFLKEHCSGLISAHWNDFTPADFSSMNSALLFDVLKSQTNFPLHSAIRLHRDDVVFLFLIAFNNELPDVLNQRDDCGDLPLNLALCEKQTNITLTLVEHNVDLNARDSHGLTLLHLATERADCYSARFLVDHGASLSIATPDTLGNTALHIVASYSPNSIKDDILAEMTEVARFMLDKGLDPNIQNKQGLSSLHLCTMAQNKYMFTLLLNLTNNPVDINIRNHDGHTALWYALHLTDTYDESSFAAQLIKKGAIPNPIYSSGDSLLHLIVREHMEDAGLFLCSFAKNINHTNKENEGALHIACAQGMAKLVSAMLAKGADPNLQMGSIRNVDIGETNVDEKFVSKQSPLHLAVSNNHEGVIRAIIEYKRNLKSLSENKNFIPDFNIKDSDGNAPISLALKKGFKHLVGILIEGGADINICDKNELTLLHQAILKADTETALFLLEKGIDINVVTTQNETPLELSIKSHLPTVVDALCRKGVDTSAPTSTNCSPIWMALESGQEDIAAILVRNGADIDYWSEGPGGCLQTLLHRAIDENNETIANFLIHSGCSLNCSRRPGVTGRSCEEAHDKASPLHLCCQWGLTSVVQTLIEHDAAINIKNEELKTPLHVAIENQNPSIISLLLCHPNIDLTLRDKRGLTPFATALTCRNIKAAQAILVKLPTAAEQFDNKGYNFLHTAIQKGDVESVLFLLSIHVDINSRVQDVTQTPPLHLAAQLGTEMIIRSLLLAGARADDHDAYRQTALHVAAAAGHEAAVSALLQNGSNFNATDSNGDNALHIAAREGHLSVARVLLTESSLDAETVNIKGQNPLHVLSRYSRENSSAMGELFLECMPNYPLNQPDLNGNTALLLAYMKGNGNLCRILVKAGACLGAMNKDGVTIFNYQVATKQLLYRILDHLSQEPTWAESDICLECGVKFGLTMRRHHCRHCGRILCSKCSDRDVPILKFNLNKPVRVCFVCFDVLQVGSN